MDMNEIINQIAQLESEITIKKTAIEKIQNDINFTKMEEQKELSEVNRLQQCNESMRNKQEEQKATIQAEINREDYDSFLSLLETELFN